MGSCLSHEGEVSRSLSSLQASGEPGKARRRYTEEDDEQLRGVPGRMCLNGSSSVASLFTQRGRKGTNQDAMVVWENFCSRTDTVFCGVFDGHGPSGHIVAKRVRDLLPLWLSAHWGGSISENEVSRCNSNAAGNTNYEKASSFSEVEPEGSHVMEELKMHPDIFLTLKESFLKASRVIDEELHFHPNIDCFCSGTTAVILVKQGQHLVIGNIGDSRAVLATQGEDDSLMAVQLTVDLKPSLPREAERIRKCNGRVFALKDEPEVPRVWLPNIEAPGLAMARAFGDFCLKKFGLISAPEVHYRCLTEKDLFVVLATDGIWDVLSNKEVVDIVAAAPARSHTAKIVVESAIKAWKRKCPASKIDDCAVVCLFVNADSDNCSAASTKGEQQSNDSSSNLGGKTGSIGSATMLDQSKNLLEIDDATTNKDELRALKGVSRTDTFLAIPRIVKIQDDKISRKKSK